MKLDQRVAALEQANAPARISVVLERIVSPGKVGLEVDTLRDRDGTRTWLRRQGEPEQAFIDRAAEELRAATPDRNRWWIPFLMGETAAA